MDIKHNCPLCGKETTGSYTYAEGGAKWPPCPDCMIKIRIKSKEKEKEMKIEIKEGVELIERKITEIVIVMDKEEAEWMWHFLNSRTDRSFLSPKKNDLEIKLKNALNEVARMEDKEAGHGQVYCEK